MLVTTTLQFARHIGALFSKETYFQQLESFVQDVETKLIEPLLGEELLTELAQPGLDELHQKVRLYAERAIVWAAFQEVQVGYLYQFGNGGMVKVMPKEAKSLALWEIDTILSDTARKADAAIEQLINCLTREKENLPAWSTSEAYRKANALLIPTTILLNEALPEVSATHSMLARLQAFMPRTERRFVAGVLGSELYEELKAKLAGNITLTLAENQLWLHCRNLLGPITLWEALPSMSVLMLPDGIRIVSSFKGLNDQKAASDSKITDLRMSLWKTAEDAKGELKRFLNKTASATVFPSYFNSGLYLAPGTSSWKEVDNSGKKHLRL
ncbi:DUF6712 family protein [Spirosoma rigui]|uniref:DUF6712 family protein n=1 Tax=Spirosoma rigui TaxID=564064 RepID=UPI0009AF689C|nr:DUF6712 family protein [Spirosoma rigui]